METRLNLDILPQPDETTCGPTCLHALYQYYGDGLPLDDVVRDVPRLEEGGTLAVLLGCHALARGYSATIYTYNLQVFDPTWFGPDAPPLADKINAQLAVKESPKLHFASRAYLEFLRLGGSIKMEDLTPELIRRYLRKAVPILTGLSATYLYGDPREYTVYPAGSDGAAWPRSIADDVRGVPAGHFVLLCGYNPDRRAVLVADPLEPNPLANRPVYFLDIDRVVNAILLGIVTYDANLLIVRPKDKRQRRARADSDHHQ